ncbi:lytic transglycosylase domain-containing protein, partial [bacterium]|nr:lytic transglycosylase domain-containing protein [candidate division CSSED10-310 bacterium]
LKFLKTLFPNDLRLVIAAYNAGEQRVIDARGIPNISETIEYVERVLNFYSQYGGTGATRPVRRYVDENGCIHLTNL